MGVYKQMPARLRIIHEVTSTWTQWTYSTFWTFSYKS